MILLGTGALDLQTYVALSENRVRPKSMAFRLPFALNNCSSIDASTRWCPPSYKLVYNPINYRYIYHKS